MCYNCGCHNPNDDMGNSDNVTNMTFDHIAKHWDKSLKETKLIIFQQIKDNKVKDSHLKDMFAKAAKAWGQSEDEAKNNTYRMLRQELGEK